MSPRMMSAFAIMLMAIAFAWPSEGLAQACGTLAEAEGLHETARAAQREAARAKEAQDASAAREAANAAASARMEVEAIIACTDSATRQAIYEFAREVGNAATYANRSAERAERGGCGAVWSGGPVTARAERAVEAAISQYEYMKLGAAQRGASADAEAILEIMQWAEYWVKQTQSAAEDSVCYYDADNHAAANHSTVLAVANANEVTYAARRLTRLLEE